MSKLKLHQEVSLEGNIYKVIGIDHYRLTNLIGKLETWDSYTLTDNKGYKTWISYGAIKNYYIQWELISEKTFKKLTRTSLNLELTGIAEVTFQGKPGYSTPNAEIVWFNLQNSDHDYVASERFLRLLAEKIEPLETYYDAGKILKDFKL